MPTDIFFAGEKLAATWKPVDVEFHPGQPSDFVPVGVGALTCTPHTWEIIRPHVQHEVEVLPVHWPQNVDLVLFHVINMVDCIDYEHTTWMSDRKTIPDVIRFREEMVQDSLLFKTPVKRATTTFSTSAFKKLIKQHNLTGMRFRRSNTSHDPTKYFNFGK